jgi:hypothetical protein
MTEAELGLWSYSSPEEKDARSALLGNFRECPIPDDEIMSNLGLFINSKNLSRIMFMDLMYRKIVNVHGSIMDFGTRWGQNAAIFTALRGIYEPFNRHRRVIACDTFSGFPSVASEDGPSDSMRVGNLGVSAGYADYLEQVLQNQERDNPAGHIRKFDIVAGDTTKELPKYLKEHPETIVALAYFDFDLYEPTKVVLEMIKDRLVKGSVVGFDELNDPDSPGETIAIAEVLGLNNIRLQRSPFTSRTSYFVVE